MQQPNIKHTAVDEANNVVFHVMAYRKLTPDEVASVIRAYRTQPAKRRKRAPERNKDIVIHTIIGLEGS